MNTNYERRSLLCKIIVLTLIIASLSVIVCSCKKKKNTDSQIISQNKETISKSIILKESFEEYESLSVESELVSEEQEEGLSQTESVFQSTSNSEIESQEESKIESESLCESVEDSQIIVESESLSEEIETSESLSKFESISNSESERETLSNSQEELESFTVVFALDNGEEIDTQYITNGQLVTPPTEPEKEGFTFLGWFLDGELFDFTTPITEAVVLKAEWKIVECIVLFYKDDGICVEEQIIDYGGYVNCPDDLEKEGYVFVGWYYEGSLYDFSLTVEKDMNLFARLEQIKPIDNFIGRWNGFSQTDANVRTLILNSDGTGTYEVFNASSMYSQTYNVEEIVHYANVLKIKLVSKGASTNVTFEIKGDQLVCIDFFLMGGEVVWIKQD